MATGPGTYDKEATAVRESTGAETVMILVVGGLRGNGFSVQTVDPDFGRNIPAMLRQMADEIERDIS
jgi:hypothetical protein